MYFHKPQEKPRKWGSFQDVQYAIRKNAEKIYQVDSDSMVLCMPLFWGLPPLDYSRKNNLGTNYGATYKDKSLYFDGSDDYVDVDNALSLNLQTFTVSLWVNQKSNVAWARIIHKGTDTKKNYSLLKHSDGRPYLVISSSETEYNTYDGSVTILPNDQRHHLIGTYDGATMRYYYDSVREGLEPNFGGGSLDTTTTNVKIGTGGGIYFNGTIDEVRISNVARTAEQIALFHDRPWALYQPVSRPVYFFQAAAGISIPVAMQNMRGGFNPIGIRGGFINAD